MPAQRSGCLSFIFGRSRKEEKLAPLPYKAKAYLLSRQEQAFYHNLRKAAGGRAAICPKVRLADIFSVKIKNRSEWQSHFNRIQNKHIDFLLCDPRSMTPLLAIELDDKTHDREDRQKRDVFVNQVFEAGGLPIIHINSTNIPSTEQLAAMLTEYLPQPEQFSGAAATT